MADSDSQVVIQVRTEGEFSAIENAQKYLAELKAAEAKQTADRVAEDEKLAQAQNDAADRGAEAEKRLAQSGDEASEAHNKLWWHLKGVGHELHGFPGLWEAVNIAKHPVIAGTVLLGYGLSLVAEKFRAVAAAAAELRTLDQALERISSLTVFSRQAQQSTNELDQALAKIKDGWQSASESLAPYVKQLEDAIKLEKEYIKAKGEADIAEVEAIDASPEEKARKKAAIKKRMGEETEKADSAGFQAKYFATREAARQAEIASGKSRDEQAALAPAEAQAQREKAKADAGLKDAEEALSTKGRKAQEERDRLKEGHDDAQKHALGIAWEWAKDTYGKVMETGDTVPQGRPEKYKTDVEKAAEKDAEFRDLQEARDRAAKLAMQQDQKVKAIAKRREEAASRATKEAEDAKKLGREAEAMNAAEETRVEGRRRTAPEEERKNSAEVAKTDRQGRDKALKQAESLLHKDMGEMDKAVKEFRQNMGRHVAQTGESVRRSNEDLIGYMKMIDTEMKDLRARIKELGGPRRFGTGDED